MSQDQTFGIVLVLVLSTVFTVARLLKGPVGQALARRIAGREPEPVRDVEVAELRARLTELEERVDFTERMLLQQQEREHIPAGGDDT